MLNRVGMESLFVGITLMLGAVILVGVGERVRLPWPVLMVLLGVVVAFLPWIPAEVRLEPEIILPLFLPPLLYATAQRTSWSVFRVRWRTILLLAVALVALTVGAVASTAMLLIPGITFSAALALGAMVAPPDPVAVESVAQQTPIPRRVLRVLQSEGLFNDATALVIFQVAVAATMEQREVHELRALAEFVVGAALAVAIGLLAGWLAQKFLLRVTDSARRSALTLVMPFAVYIIADQVHASGVIAVVVFALQMGTYAHQGNPADRLAQRSFWDVIELLVTGVAFGLIGLEIREVVDEVEGELGEMLMHAAVISAVVIAVRAFWLGFVWLGVRRDPTTQAAPRTTKEIVLLTWCGMRGLATLALALSLPATVANGDPFPARQEIIVVACTVLLVTLLFAGLTLPLLVRLLHIDRESDAEMHAERELTRRAYGAAWKAVTSQHHREPVPEHVLKAVRGILERIESGVAAAVRTDDEHEVMHDVREHVHKVRMLQSAALAAARAEVLAARSEPGVDPEVADRVLHHLDIKSVAHD